MNRGEGEYFNVRETARLLGVHENTVRNWVKDGLLPDARLPGTRFLRFRRRDVERLQGQRGVAAPSLKADRINVNPELAGANQLRRWALDESRNAQQFFPELVRRLLVETPGISSISVRAGDGIALPGWDGLADADGSAAFLPVGQLRIELGIEKSPEGKAQRDYDKRVQQQPEGKVFLFVTPHRWARKEAWADDRRTEGRFADVRVLDGDDLEGWLKTAPAAHHWLSEHLGLSPRNAQTIDTWWERFSAAHDPALPRELFLSGRDADANALRTRLTNAPQLTTVQAEWVNDCLAFVYAALSAPPTEGPRVDASAIVVQSAEVWDRILDQPGQAILIPLFDGADVGRALDRMHQVINVIDKTTAARRAVDINLPRPSRPEAQSAFEAIGLDHRKAGRLAVLARRSLPALARTLSRNSSFSKPRWAQAPDSLVYTPLVLTGAWTSAEADVNAVEALTGQNASIIIPLVEAVTGTSDPLLRRVGTTTMVASPEEAFWLLKESLNSKMLDDWLRHAQEILLDPDPALDLAPDERYLAGVRGLKRRYSSTLIRGVAQGFAMLGSMGQTTLLEDGLSVSERTAEAVRQLLNAANSDTTGRKYHLLAPSLPLLAEAAPEAFVTAINDSLDMADPVVLTLFQEVDHSFTLGPSSPHPHVLWALETLCWADEFLVDSARALTRLAANEPGGKSGNRPSASLSTVLCGWTRNTAASFETRSNAIDGVLGEANEVGWQLLCDLWPSDHGSVMSPASPRFRDDWSPADRSVSMTEWANFASRLVDRALAHAGGQPERLAKMVTMLSTLPPQDRDRVIAFLQERASALDLSDDARLRLWEQLEATIAQHRRYSTATWAMDSVVLDRLKDFADSLEPSTDPRKYARLFGWHPHLDGVDQTDFETYRVRLHQARADVIGEILQDNDWLARLATLARQATAPSQVGWVLRDFTQVDVQDLIPWLAGDDVPLREAAGQVVQSRLYSRGATYLAELLRIPGLSDEARGLVLRTVPAGGEYWEVLAHSPNVDDLDRYWQTAPIEVVPVADSEAAIAQLVAHGRAWSALAVASYALTQDKRDESTDEASRLDPAAIIALLEAAFEQRPGDGEISQMTSHYLGELLDYLGTAGIDDPVIARFEFAYFRLLEHSREPAAFNRALANEPELFVDLVKRIYRAKDEPRREQSSADSGLATQAYSVLRGWSGFPGRSDDGTVDKAVLDQWISKARLLLSEVNRADIGDEVIGESFGHSPVGSDGIWPAEPIREVIEGIGSRELENGIVIGRLNSRGVTSRGVYDGGKQERALAVRHREWSVAAKTAWPRTARILRSVSDSYERDARHQDVAAELDADQF